MLMKKILAFSHHVVPQALGQLLMSLHGEVETVWSEEAHVNLPILNTDIQTSGGEENTDITAPKTV